MDRTSKPPVTEKSVVSIMDQREYKVDENEPDHKFPPQSNEKHGHWVGFADNKGDQLTWKILTDETQQIITRSSVRTATKTTPNVRLNTPEGRINHKI